MRDILETTRIALAEVSNHAELADIDSDDLLVDLGFDSIAIVELAVVLERHLSRRLSDDDIAALSEGTVGDLDELMTAWATHAVAPLGSAITVAAPASPDDPYPSEPSDRLVIRRFVEADREQMATICRQSCHYRTRRAMAHLLWLYQYLDQEPEGCFVAVRDDEVLGYWVGTSDEPRFALGFRAHVRRYLSDFVRAYVSVVRVTPFSAPHIWIWKLVIASALHPKFAFRSYNRRDRLGPILSMTRAHFQVSPSNTSTRVVFELARAWLRHLRTRGVAVTCLPSMPGVGNETGLALFWRRVGYRPVTSREGTVLIAVIPDA